LNATTGALLNTLNTDRSVIADVSLLTNSAGMAQYAYTADLGGNVYRIDMTSGAPGTWTITKLASLGCATILGCVDNRKFMFAPDVVSYGGTNYVLLGSGDREKPLRSYTAAFGVTNYFFMLKDNPTDSSWLTSEFGTCADNVLCLNSLANISADSAPDTTDLAAKKGWYLDLNAHEQVVTTAITIFGDATFSTHIPYVPSTGQCKSELGTTNIYRVGFRGTTVNRTVLPPVGLPPSPVAGMVTLDNGETVPFCIGCSPDSPLEAMQPTVPSTSAPSQPRNRVYWYIKR
jgi:type IV pilus assembly protein PilY1